MAQSCACGTSGRSCRASCPRPSRRAGSRGRTSAADRRDRSEPTATGSIRRCRTRSRKPTRPAAVAAPGTRRRSARSLRWIPRVVRAAARPLIAERELAGRELRDEHGAGRVQPRHDRGILIEHLRRKRRRAPARRRALRRDDVLHAVRNAVQQAEIVAGAELPIRVGGLAIARSSVSAATQFSTPL